MTNSEKRKVTIYLLLFFIIIGLYLTNLEIKEQLVYNKVKGEEMSKRITSLENEVDSYEHLLAISQLTELRQNKTVNYFYGIATAYHPPSGGINADSNPEVTSTGRRAEVGIIAVNPKMIPYGSQVMIIAGKTVIRGVAGDTGSAMRRNPKQVDILMGSYKEAMEWGRQEVHIIHWKE